MTKDGFLFLKVKADFRDLRDGNSKTCRCCSIFGSNTKLLCYAYVIRSYSAKRMRPGHLFKNCKNMGLVSWHIKFWQWNIFSFQYLKFIKFTGQMLVRYVFVLPLLFGVTRVTIKQYLWSTMYLSFDFVNFFYYNHQVEMTSCCGDTMPQMWRYRQAR